MTRPEAKARAEALGAKVTDTRLEEVQEKISSGCRSTTVRLPVIRRLLGTDVQCRHGHAYRNDADLHPSPSPPGMPLGQVGPPPGLDNPSPPQPQPRPQARGGDRSGNYAGTAVPLDTGGGICIDTKQVTNLGTRQPGELRAVLWNHCAGWRPADAGRPGLDRRSVRGRDLPWPAQPLRSLRRAGLYLHVQSLERAALRTAGAAPR